MAAGRAQRYSAKTEIQETEGWMREETGSLIEVSD